MEVVRSTLTICSKGTQMHIFTIQPTQDPSRFIFAIGDISFTFTKLSENMLKHCISISETAIQAFDVILHLSAEEKLYIHQQINQFLTGLEYENV